MLKPVWLGATCHSIPPTVYPGIIWPRVRDRVRVTWGSTLKTGRPGQEKYGQGLLKVLQQLIHIKLSNYFFITDSIVLISIACSLLALNFMHEISIPTVHAYGKLITAWRYSFIRHFISGKLGISRLLYNSGFTRPHVPQFSSFIQIDS